jgi:phosphoribosylformylglycinamidine cyclo-ligase
MFDLKEAGYKDPVLVAATDGVGTKLLIAKATGNHSTIGIDLVAMCVNDLVVQGAEPLFFLDYLATGKLDIDAGKDLITGVVQGCNQAGCALIGGETAEMPGLYSSGDYDLAGFAVGAAERDNIIKGDAIKPNDIIFGLTSTGLHSNGYSLVRQIVSNNQIDYEQNSPFSENITLGCALLEPTRIYVKSCLNALTAGGVHGFAHITGGGLLENIPRIIPHGLTATIDTKKWSLPPVFQWISKTGNLSALEMVRTFNCGIGMVVICAPEAANELEIILNEAGETVICIGNINESASGEGPLVFANLEESWNL